MSVSRCRFSMLVVISMHALEDLGRTCAEAVSENQSSQRVDKMENLLE